MGFKRLVFRVVAFLRAGYPKGAPDVGYGPLLALLPRRVTDDEVTGIARELFALGGIDNAEVGVAIIGVSDEMPSADDIERVLAALQAGRHDG